MQEKASLMDGILSRGDKLPDPKTGMGEGTALGKSAREKGFDGLFPSAGRRLLLGRKFRIVVRTQFSTSESGRP